MNYLGKTAVTAAMDKYLEEQYYRGLLFLWELRDTSIPYTRHYNGIQWTAVCSFMAWHSDPPVRFYSAHPGTFTEILMPELSHIAVDNFGQILVEPYMEQNKNGKFWRLEVDENKERSGVWEFKPERRPKRSDLLCVKFKVWSLEGTSSQAFAPGARVEQ